MVEMVLIGGTVIASVMGVAHLLDVNDKRKLLIADLELRLQQEKDYASKTLNERNDALDRISVLEANAIRYKGLRTEVKELTIENISLKKQHQSIASTLHSLSFQVATLEKEVVMRGGTLRSETLVAQTQ